MERYLASLLFGIWLCPVLSAQQQAPALLREAAQCLVAKTFLKSSALSLGYLVTTKDWPGEEVVYVVAYTSSSRSVGFVFTIFPKQENRHQALYITNNAKFVRTKKDPFGVDFVEDPLGGVWTQDHLVSAIKRIEKQPRYEIPAVELSRVSSTESCHSYADLFMDHKQPSPVYHAAAESIARNSSTAPRVKGIRLAVILLF